jgi:hypothetical protein
MTAMENNLTEVRNSLRDNVTSWQSETRQQVSQEIRSIEISNREKLEQMNVEINSLKERLSESPSVACNARSLQTTDNNQNVSPSACDSAHNSCNSNYNNSGNNSPTNGVVVGNGNGSDCDRPAPYKSYMYQGLPVNLPTSQVHDSYQYTAPSDLTLPHFHHSAKVNPMSHFKHLDDYFRLKANPFQFHLPIVLRSVTDPLALDWLPTVGPTITTYEEFKLAFQRNYWSKSKQHS